MTCIQYGTICYRASFDPLVQHIFCRLSDIFFGAIYLAEKKNYFRSIMGDNYRATRTSIMTTRWPARGGVKMGCLWNLHHNDSVYHGRKLTDKKFGNLFYMTHTIAETYQFSCFASAWLRSNSPMMLMCGKFAMFWGQTSFTVRRSEDGAWPGVECC